MRDEKDWLQHTVADLAPQIEKFWKNSRLLACMLVLAAMGLALFATYYPRSPGWSIGMLALVAGIMSLRPEMHIFEKVSWIVLLIIFAILEVNAINRSDNDNKDVRDKQNQSFQAIVNELKNSTATSQNNYTNTIGHVDEVLQQTKEISDQTRKNLLAITGGNSYAYITPQSYEGTYDYALGLNNGGSEILTGISVTISKIITKDCVPFPFGKPLCIMDSGLMHPVTVPSLAGHAFYEMPITMPTQLDGSDMFFVLIQAQNGNAEELIRFRKSKNGKGLAYRFEVRTGVKYPSISSGKIRKQSDWQEPLPQLPHPNSN